MGNMVDSITGIRRAHTTIEVNVTLTQDELKALIEHVDQFLHDKFKQHWPFGNDTERFELDALQALQDALPYRGPH